MCPYRQLGAQTTPFSRILGAAESCRSFVEAAAPMLPGRDRRNVVESGMEGFGKRGR